MCPVGALSDLNRGDWRLSYCIIVGHARSGTTVLLNALNACKDIYLLGEPHLYRNGRRENFVGWFNAQHANWGNQPVKSSYVPELPGLEPDANGNDYIDALSQRVQIVGEKIVLGPEAAGHDFDKLRSWLERKHWSAHIIFALRRPSNIIASCQKMYGDEPADLVQSVAKTLQTALATARIFPKVTFVVYEDVADSTFEVLGRWLDVDLSGAYNMYTVERPVYKNFGADLPIANKITQLDAIYESLLMQLNTSVLAIPRYLLQIQQPIPQYVGIKSVWKCSEELTSLSAGF